jgi:N-acylglucosamine-6-phosphate 2-epimerase
MTRTWPVPRGLIVSSQAPKESPLRDPEIIAALAEAAVLAGAIAIRCVGAADIAAVKKRVNVPVIGLLKRQDSIGRTLITPTVEDAITIYEAGADAVAVAVTLLDEVKEETSPDRIGQILRELEMPILADVGDVASAVAAEEAGAAAVATTLAGYLDESVESPTDPDIGLVWSLAERLSIPVIAEGRYQHPEQLEAAYQAGAHGIVIGRAITDPVYLTRKYAAVRFDPDSH